MIRDRERLESKLAEVISNNRRSKSFLHEINMALREYNIKIGTFNDIAKNPVGELRGLESGLLYLVAKEVFVRTGTGDEQIDPGDFLSADEIKEAEKQKAEFDQAYAKPPLTFHPVIRVADYDFITKISGEQLLKLLAANLIHYRFYARRAPLYKRKKGKRMNEAYTNLKAVKEISESIANGNYLPDTLAFNVYSEEVEPYHYDETNLTLTIRTGVCLDVLDGFHRLKGLERAKLLGRSTNVNFNLAIKSYDEETAKRYFARKELDIQ